MSGGALETLAGALELASLERRGSTLAGQVQGQEVTLREAGRGIVVTVEVTPSLRLVPQARAPRASRDLTVGVPELDAAMVISGENPAAVIRTLRHPGLDARFSALLRERIPFSVQDGALEAELPAADARRWAREVLALARAIDEAAEAEEARSGGQRRALQPPVRPLRDLSGDLQAPPPVHPLNAARWRGILRYDRAIALVAGVPLVILCVGLAVSGAPKWTLAIPLAVIAAMQTAEALLFRCPGCKARLERRGLQQWGKPLVCRHCGTRVA